MAIRFRRTVRIAPGLKLNIGKKSASIRIGGKNAGYTIGTAGRTTSASIPGTGLGITSRKRHGKGGGGEELLAVHDEFLQYRLFDVSGQGGLFVVCRRVQPR